jgi:hypothetical protein
MWGRMFSELTNKQIHTFTLLSNGETPVGVKEHNRGRVCILCRRTCDGCGVGFAALWFGVFALCHYFMMNKSFVRANLGLFGFV